MKCEGVEVWQRQYMLAMNEENEEIEIHKTTMSIEERPQWNFMSFLVNIVC
jgi:hypothetical protein